MCNQFEDWEPLFGAYHSGMNVSAGGNFYRYLDALASTSTHHVKLYQKLLISPEKPLWRLMMDLHQTLCKSHEILIAFDEHKNHPGGSPADYLSKYIII